MKLGGLDVHVCDEVRLMHLDSIYVRARCFSLFVWFSSCGSGLLVLVSVRFMSELDVFVLSLPICFVCQPGLCSCVLEVYFRWWIVA
jgi:hypothetical protein